MHFLDTKERNHALRIIHINILVNMMNSLVQFAKELLHDEIEVRFSAYVRNCTEDIAGLYLDATQKSRLINYYEILFNSRNSLSEGIASLRVSSLSKSMSVDCYLNAVKDLFLQYFIYEGNKSAVVNDCVLEQIIYTDITVYDDAQIYVGLSNPLILESLLICSKQIIDYHRLNGILSDDSQFCIKLYQEHLLNKIDRLFRDIIILYKKRFYRIIGYSQEKNAFIAKDEDELESIEEISATRLYEKVCGRDQNKDKKVLVIGRTIDYGFESGSSKELLKEMVGAGIKIDFIYNKEEIRRVLRQAELENKIDIYDKVFILDCPEIYYPIELKDMDDYSDVIRRANKPIAQILKPVSGKLDFYNKNGFAAIYYRVQNYLLNKSRGNTSKSRRINTAILDFVKEKLSILCNEKGKENKEVYVYISNNRDFRDELYDIYNFTRLERYNSKDCRIIRFGKLSKPDFDQEKCIQVITVYKILKMVSHSEDFHREFTDVDGDFLKTLERSKNTKIFIDYSNLNLQKNGTYRFKLKIEINYNCEVSEKYKEAVNTLIKEAFNFCREIDNRILLYCYKKAFANVLSGCAHNFNDLLFNHLYLSAVNGNTNIIFNIVELNWTQLATSGDVAETNPSEETSSYSYKRVAYNLMTMLDRQFYRNSSIVDQYRMVTANNEKLRFYVEMLMAACENVGYTSSKLYSRLNELY